MSKVLVVGGGIIGLCSAYYARKAGLDVTLIEQDAPDHQPASWGNAGMIVPSHFVPLASPGMVAYGLKMWLRGAESPFGFAFPPSWELLTWMVRFALSCNPRNVEKAAPILAAMHLQSREEHQKLSEELGGFELATRGLLMLCKDRRVLEEEAHLITSGARHGIRARLLNRDETAAADPGFEMDVCGSVLFEDDAHLNPMLLMEKLRAKLTEMGVQMRYSEHVNWAHLREWDHVVLAAGSWTTALAKTLKIKIPMASGKGHSFLVPEPAALPQLCSLLTEARVAVTPMGGQLRFGGTMELGGLDRSVNPARVRGIQEAIPDYLPQFKLADFERLPVWAGLRPCSPDGLPYLGKVGNLIIATGHGMMGLSLGPITGKIIAELITSQPTSVPIDLCNPTRFS